MADKIIHEMISAFAAGCIDKENFIQFKDYINSGGELPKGELGELQNIIAMIPVILDLEQPDPKIKDMVARKLIGMKEEFKGKLSNEYSPAIDDQTSKPTVEKQAAFPPIVPPKKNTLTFITKKTDNTNKFNYGNDDFDSTFAERKISPQIKPATPEKPEPANNEPPRMEVLTKHDPPSFSEIDKSGTSVDIFNSTSEKLTEQKAKSNSNMLVWITLALSLLLFGLTAFYSFYVNSQLKDQVRDLRSEIVALQSQINLSKDFIGNYSALIDFFSYQDIIEYSLSNLDPSQKAAVRILLSYSNKKGFIQFKDAIEIAPDQTFQIWLYSNGQPISLGTYSVLGGQYQQLISFPVTPKELTESIRITIEPVGGSEVPSSNTVFVSNIEAPKTGRYR